VSKTSAFVPGCEAENLDAEEEIMLLYSWTMVLFGRGWEVAWLLGWDGSVLKC
jgi:hypothetical protein